jgi:hypothetical protein
LTSYSNYGVELAENGCVDTSACISIAPVYINDHVFENNLIIYPNPSNGNFTIDMGKTNNEIEIVLTDLAGRMAYVENFQNSRYLNLDIDFSATGVYLLTALSNKRMGVPRLIIE